MRLHPIRTAVTETTVSVDYRGKYVQDILPIRGFEFVGEELTVRDSKHLILLDVH